MSGSDRAPGSPMQDASDINFAKPRPAANEKRLGSDVASPGLRSGSVKVARTWSTDVQQQKDHFITGEHYLQQLTEGETYTKPRYYKNTNMPVDGWIHPCRLCRAWTSFSLQLGKEMQMYICKRCVKGLADEHIMMDLDKDPKLALQLSRSYSLPVVQLSSAIHATATKALKAQASKMKQSSRAPRASRRRSSSQQRPHLSQQSPPHSDQQQDTAAAASQLHVAEPGWVKSETRSDASMSIDDLGAVISDTSAAAPHDAGTSGPTMPAGVRTTAPPPGCVCHGRGLCSTCQMLQASGGAFYAPYGGASNSPNPMYCMLFHNQSGRPGVTAPPSMQPQRSHSLPPAGPAAKATQPLGYGLAHRPLQSMPPAFQPHQQHLLLHQAKLELLAQQHAKHAPHSASAPGQQAVLMQQQHQQLMLAQLQQQARRQQVHQHVLDAQDAEHVMADRVGADQRSTRLLQPLPAQLHHSAPGLSSHSLLGFADGSDMHHKLPAAGMAAGAHLANSTSSAMLDHRNHLDQSLQGLQEEVLPLLDLDLSGADAVTDGAETDSTWPMLGMPDLHAAQALAWSERSSNVSDLSRYISTDSHEEELLHNDGRQLSWASSMHGMQDSNAAVDAQSAWHQHDPFSNSLIQPDPSSAQLHAYLAASPCGDFVL